MKRERTIDLDDEEYSILKRVIESRMPYNEIWAYGSRVKWNASESADLDLVVFGSDSSALSDFRDALGESDLFVSVDVMDWENISDDFKENIKKKYVVVQKNTIPKGWGEVKLDDVADIINGGTPRTSNTEYWGGDIAWITPKDLSKRKRILIDKGERNISAAGLNNSSACLLPKGTVLLTSRAPIGYLAVANNPLSTNQGFKGLIVKKDIAHNLFIYYWLKTKVEYLKSIGSGSVFSEISASVLKNVSICLPTLSEQKTIAEILGSLGDKIDLLRRQNKTLENIAQTLLRKWFIEDEKNHNPQKKKKISEIAPFTKGRKPLKAEKVEFDGSIPQILIDTFEGGMPLYSEKDKMIIAEKTDILMVMDGGSSGRTEIGFHGVVGSTIGKFHPTENFNYPFFIFHFLKQYETHIKNNTTGSAIPHANTAIIFNLEIPSSNIEKISKFEKIAKTLFEKKQSNHSQIITLEKMQDSLLPKLMSGKIRVSLKSQRG